MNRGKFVTGEMKRRAFLGILAFLLGMTIRQSEISFGLRFTIGLCILLALQLTIYISIDWYQWKRENKQTEEESP